MQSNSKPDAPIPAPIAFKPARRSLGRLEVYDPAMCCATGVCGPQVDPALARFAADLQWLQAQGIEVRRFNLAQQPAAFVQNELVNAALQEKGESALPLILANGEVAASGQYPAREALARRYNLPLDPGPAASSCDCGGNCEGSLKG